MYCKYRHCLMKKHTHSLTLQSLMAHRGNIVLKVTEKRRSWTSRGGSKPRRTAWLTVSRNVTVTISLWLETDNLCGYVPVLAQRENLSTLQNADFIDTGSVTATRVDSVFVTLISFYDRCSLLRCSPHPHPPHTHVSQLKITSAHIAANLSGPAVE